MATSKCPGCNGASFEAQLKTVVPYRFPLIFIQCSACGTVVGVMTEDDPGVLGKDNKDAIADLGNRLTRIEQAIEALALKPG